MAVSELDYKFLRDVVLTQSANLIEPSRNALFDTKLTPIARMAGAANLEALVGMLRVDRTTQLHQAVAEAMTINETSFFRDARPFEALRTEILPRLIEQKEGERRLRIWSAASSTGQEAYSLAMLLCEHFPELGRWDVRIVGTDISRQVVDYAEAGRYRRLEVNRGLPARMLVKYFERQGDEWQISEKIRAMCEFKCVNLCAPLLKLPVFDLVLLRNVLLYFPSAGRSAVFEGVYRQMTPGGYLLLGNAEQAEDSTELFGVEFASECYFYRPVATS
ncbi:CheR family methyltransferase [Granulicella tundricola]|uniref:MCP methyltransferase, CheR-type n=1 Tax=Granulicella tundricola (strain ATCC BAA-1859 / DSM 23138 / MP5ACTX9) TaxID=1198114 RepID=E8X306_GRATM|nr:protein-glutamate O-methyltransferase CheR [Granulicella tundricola]ADW68140.1 MCP methyltransferase, CheR-type [Granulicella tundricola MP5ACTX9]